MALGAKYLSAVSLDSKRRLRLLFVGAVLTLSPYLLIELAQVIGGFNFEQTHQDISWLVYVVFFLFPFVLAYVILVHKAMDIRVVLRQSLQYALARNGVRLIQLILTVIIVFMAVILVVGRSSNRLREIAVIAAGLLLIQAIGRGSDKVRLWVDKRFFREAYNAERVLSEVSDQVRTIIEPDSLLKLVANCISTSLHVPHIAVLLDSEGQFRPAYLHGLGKLPQLCFAGHSRTVTELRSKEPIRVYLEDQKSWIYQDPKVGDNERAEMARLQTELLLPLAGREKLLGFMSLGGKRSGEPFTGSDLRLLKSVATQTGLALENTQLLAAITQEVAQRERINRELEIAREVQERLFPQAVPEIRGVDCYGACRPAEGVGGDYYDFLKLRTGALGIAIGDVSGKGISASLLMASLVFALRSEAIRVCEELTSLVSNVNVLVYQASPINRYATLFLGIYDPQTRRLSYVNAGHNPPMLFRKPASRPEVVRLNASGTAVGLFENSCYQQEVVTLEPGDVLVAFTDGITEAMNASEQEWGEERLIQTVSTSMEMPAAEILAQVMQAADTFTAGARQYDDMTLITLKIDF
ncbi:MAG TPA: GAF domain-containing SpoIIE family protein phosphatase [Candidatus Angelobacter sp.]